MDNKDKPIIHKVLSPCDAYACCGATACNWNKTVKWEECNCNDCLRFKRRIKEKVPKKRKRFDY